MTLRRLPPAASPLSMADVCCGVLGTLQPASTRAAIESELAQALGVSRVALVSSGRAALELILKAFRELNPTRHAVVIPAYSCFSVPAAVVKAGLTVKLCDIDPATLDFDFDHLAALVAEADTLCVVSTHLFGLHANVTRASALAGPHDVFVIDDAAQAFGVMTPDGPAGTLGDAGVYSFGRGKAVTAVEGGAVVSRSPRIVAAIERQQAVVPEPGFAHSLFTLIQAAALMVLLRPSLYWLPAALPFLRLGETIFSTEFAVEKMSGAAAGLLRRWRKRVEQMNAMRSSRAAAIADQVPTVRRSHEPCIRLPIICASLAERDRLLVAGTQAGLGFSLMYPTALSAVPELNAFVRSRAFPHAERLAECLLTVPVHPYVSDLDSRHISRLLRSAVLRKVHQ